MTVGPGAHSFTLQDTAWQTRGACNDVPDREVMFPPRGATPARVAEGKQVCAGCPVRQACGEFAIRTNQRYGIWGGATERERRGLRRSFVATGMVPAMSEAPQPPPRPRQRRR